MATVGFEEIVSLDDLADAMALLERQRAHVALAAAQLAASGSYAADGSLSMAVWLQQHCRMSHAAAVGLLREGRFLVRHEAVRAAATT